MKKIALFVFGLGFGMLVHTSVMQNSTIIQQQILIRQMTKNPSCMVDTPPLTKGLPPSLRSINPLEPREQ